MHWRLFADLREEAGTGRVTIKTNPSTVGEALDALLESNPELEQRVCAEDGVADHINILVEGEYIDSLERSIDEDTELALMPPVSGG